MNNKFGRAITHLAKTFNEEAVLHSFQTVEDLFGSDWLKKNEGHRLQLLWARKDYISSCELFALGKAMAKLNINNLVWLESTVKEIKKNKDTSHGLITEVIAIGSLSTSKGVIKPCTKSYPIYDYTVNYESEYQYKVSIKNFDISDHEKEFMRKCSLIRKTFLNYFNKYRKSGVLRVICGDSILTEELLITICSFIVAGMHEYGTYQLDKSIIVFKAIDSYGSSRPLPPSDTVVVLAKQHHNEQRNIESKIASANKSMLKDNGNDRVIKKLLIRLGETTNLDRVKKYIEKIAEDHENCGFDLCLLFQPTVASNVSDNSTEIVTTIYPIGRSFYSKEERFEEKIMRMGQLNLEIGVGSLLTKPAPLKLMNDNSIMDINLSEFYVYQKGDIYVELQKYSGGYKGELTQPAPGITINVVFDKVTIKPIVYSDNNRLLIV